MRTRWQVGDLAYISGHPTGGSLSHGDIVRVTEVYATGPCFGFYDAHLGDYNRKPLRVARVGETLQRGTKYIPLRKNDRRVVIAEHDWNVSGYGVEVAIVSSPDTKQDEILKRIENAERELEAAKAELNS